MKSVLQMAVGFLILSLVSQVSAKPAAGVIRHLGNDVAGLGIVRMAFSLKMVETALAVLSVTLVTLTYSVLIRRAPLMSTTALYPRRSIERNIGNLLTQTWPRRSNEEPGTGASLQTATETSSPKRTRLGSSSSRRPSIRLFYLGRMDTDDHTGIVAKGLLECAAIPDDKEGQPCYHRLWISNGSPLTRNIVQLLVWEWVSLWLILIMLFATLLYNGFLTDKLYTDSYPRLAVVIIYSLAYLFHVWYVWRTCGKFFTNVAAGAAWSLLERARFAVCERKEFDRHRKGSLFKFRGIDKASAEYVPLTQDGLFKHEVNLTEGLTDDSTSLPTPAQGQAEDDDPGEVRAALATLDSAQKGERATATESVVVALDRVIANAIVMMGITISSGFSSWTARESTENSPNNFSTVQIGSLALLGTLALGVASMFTSAMHLSILDSSYETILSLKETKINGHAIDHYKRRESSDTPLSFSRGTVPMSSVGFFEILSTNRLRNLPSLLLFGPALILMAKRADHERTSEETQFDLRITVRDGPGANDGSSTVLFTTRGTDRHRRGREKKNLEAINVCYIQGDEKWETKDGTKKTDADMAKENFSREV